MMKRFLPSLLLVVAMLLASTLSVAAQAPVDVYVDEDHAGNEAGTKTEPYNTFKEAEAYAQSQPNGGYVYIRQPDDTWGEPKRVYECEPGIPGTPLPHFTLYVLLAILAFALIVVGWRFRRRARQLDG